MSGNGGNPHSLRDLLGTYEKSGLGVCAAETFWALVSARPDHCLAGRSVRDIGSAPSSLSIQPV